MISFFGWLVGFGDEGFIWLLNVLLVWSWGGGSCMLEWERNLPTDQASNGFAGLVNQPEVTQVRRHWLRNGNSADT